MKSRDCGVGPNEIVGFCWRSGGASVYSVRLLGKRSAGAAASPRLSVAGLPLCWCCCAALTEADDGLSAAKRRPVLSGQTAHPPRALRGRRKKKPVVSRYMTNVDIIRIRVWTSARRWWGQITPSFFGGVVALVTTARFPRQRVLLAASARLPTSCSLCSRRGSTCQPPSIHPSWASARRPEAASRGTAPARRSEQEVRKVPASWRPRYA